MPRPAACGRSAPTSWGSCSTTSPTRSTRKVAAGFEEAAASQGYAVFIMTGLHDQEREQRALTAFVEHRADGIIVASCVSDPADVLARVRADRVVFVQPDYPALADGAEPPARGVVRTDDTRRAWPPRCDTSSNVATGASPTPARADGPPTRGGVRPRRPPSRSSGSDRSASSTSPSMPGGMRPGWPATLAADPPDAVLCYDDKLALGLLDALRSTSLVVPDDMAVVGFDGIPAARQSWPRLTTVEVPSVEVGRHAVEMLIASVRDGRMPASEVLPVSLVIGDSTPPRDAADPQPRHARRRSPPRPGAGS